MFGYMFPTYEVRGEASSCDAVLQQCRGVGLILMIDGAIMKGELNSQMNGGYDKHVFHCVRVNKTGQCRVNLQRHWQWILRKTSLALSLFLPVAD